MKVLGALLIPVGLMAQSLASWPYHKLVVLDHRYVLTTLSGFTATVFVPETFVADKTAGDADMTGRLRTDCANVRFATTAGTLLPSKIIDGTCDFMRSRFAAKVKVDLTAAADTVLRVYFGNLAATAADSTGLYESGYKGAWFGGVLTDHSGNGNNLVANGDGTWKTAPGKLGTDFRFLDAASQLTTSGTIAGSASFSLNAWIRGEQNPQKQRSSGYSQPLTVGTNSYEFTWDAANPGGDARFGSSNSSLSGALRTVNGKEDHLYAISCSGGVFSVFLDGAPRGSTPSIGNCNVGAQTLKLGGGQSPAWFEGQVGGIEYQTVAKPVEFWYTKWVNEAHPEYFIKFGSLEVAGAPQIALFTEAHGYFGVEAGQAVTLRWIVSGADSLSINQGVGAQAALFAGSVAVTPGSTTTYTLTATNASGSTNAAVTVTILTAPLVYARSGPPAGSYIVGYTTATPAQISVGDPLPVTVGDYVRIDALAADDAAHGYFSDLQGVSKIKQIIDSEHFTITTKAGVDLTANAAWISGTWNPGGDPAHNFQGHGPSWIGKVTPYSFVSGPRGILDGTNGYRSRSVALGTHNGLTSFVVNSDHTATVQISFTTSSENIAADQKVSVWGTCNGATCGASFALNNGKANTTDYTVSAVGANSFTLTGLDNSIPAGDYTHHDACGPSAGNPNVVGGTENCVILSFFATKANTLFTRVRSNSTTSVNNYKHPFDGGTAWLPGPLIANMGDVFLVDRENQDLLNGLLYYTNSIERVSGVNFALNHWGKNGGNIYADLNNGQEIWSDVAYIIGHAMNYLTADQKTAVASKVANHRMKANETGCTQVVPQLISLSSRTAQGGSGSTIVLNASESLNSTNNIIYFNNGTDVFFGLVGSYNAGTKTATISSIDAWNIETGARTTPATWTAPAAGQAYQIYATASISGTTVTGYNTSFTSYQVGDALVAFVGDPSSPFFVINGYPKNMEYISAIASDTQLTAIRAQTTTLTATPKLIVRVPKWQAGDCGMMELLLHNMMGSQPIQRPINAGNGSETSSSVNSYAPGMGSNNKTLAARAYIELASVVADLEPAQAADGWEMAQSWWWDYEFRFRWMFDTPVNNQEPNYSFGNIRQKNYFPLWNMKSHLVGFPMPSISTLFWDNFATMVPYRARPDEYGGDIWDNTFGGDGAANKFNTAGGMAVLLTHTPSTLWQPFATSSLRWKDWLNKNLDVGSVNTDNTRRIYYDVDPRIPASNYAAQPLQYFLTNTDQGRCSLTTGWDCSMVRADMVFSRTSWSDRNATEVMINGRTYQTGGYDTLQGNVWLHKNGIFLGNDWYLSPGQGNYSSATGGYPAEAVIEFNGANTYRNTGANSPAARSTISRWYAPSISSWSQYYGDPDSCMVYSMIDLTNMYTPTYNRVNKHVFHFKCGVGELLAQFDDVDTANQPATQIKSLVHFAQTGEAASSSYGTFAEGQTTCVPNADCSGGIQAVLSAQNLAPADGLGVARTNGLVSTYFTPRTMSLIWDGSTYTGNRGHTKRLSLTTTDPILEAFHVYEIRTGIDQDQSWSTPSSAAVNPDENWTGVTASAHTALVARGGVLRTSLPATIIAPGDLFVAGLQAGTYSVLQNGSFLALKTVTSSSLGLYVPVVNGTITIVQGIDPSAVSMSGSFQGGSYR